MRRIGVKNALLLFLALVWTAISAAVPAGAGTPLDTGSPEDAKGYIDSLVKDHVQDPVLLQQLIDALNNPDSAVPIKERCAWALGQLQVHNALPALLTAAHHKGLLVRSAALDSLLHMRELEAIPVLTDIAQSDPILYLRQRATLALGVLQSDKTITALVKLSSDPRAEVRGAAALAMACLQSKKNDFREVLAQMVSDQDEYVQERARRALSVAQGKSASILAALHSNDADTRLIAALYLHHHGSKKDIPALARALKTEQDDEALYEMNNAVQAIKKRAAVRKHKKKRSKKKKAAATPTPE